jgi:hypothetical protein
MPSLSFTEVARPRRMPSPSFVEVVRPRRVPSPSFVEVAHPRRTGKKKAPEATVGVGGGGWEKCDQSFEGFTLALPTTWKVKAGTPLSLMT